MSDKKPRRIIPVLILLAGVVIVFIILMDSALHRYNTPVSVPLTTPDSTYLRQADSIRNARRIRTTRQKSKAPRRPARDPLKEVVPQD